MISIKNKRNVAIIAHVDHGKTTILDKLLHYTGNLKSNSSERVLDSNDLEKERGITILAKNTTINWKEHSITLIDTPGHADFGGEVERVLSMVDAVLLVVDAAEGPMPQTRFVTKKAFERGLKPLLVINKIDKQDARIDWVINQVFDMFCDLEASDEQLEFPIIYTSATKNIAAYQYKDNNFENMSLLLDMIIKYVDHPNISKDNNLQMQISSLDYSSYVGTIGIGKIYAGTIIKNTPISIIHSTGETQSGKIIKLYSQQGLERVEIEQANAGDIVAIAGIENLKISDTICAAGQNNPLPNLSVDEPTVGIVFMVNDSPLAGKEGKFLTSNKIKDRLDKELLYNVALKVENTDSSDKFKVSGRGELHLSILIENMRREGFEFAISKPEVITKKIDNEIYEPYEKLLIDIPSDYQGVIMEELNLRYGQLDDLITETNSRVRLEYTIPTRGLIGFHAQFIGYTSGNGIMNHTFLKYLPQKSNKNITRKNGALIAKSNGNATAYSIWNIQQRGKLMVIPQTNVYEGMIVGLNNRADDLIVNITKEKQLTNIRAAGKDEKIILTPPVKITLEWAIDNINDDELVEITPENIRLRKKFLKEHERKRQNK